MRQADVQQAVQAGQVGEAVEVLRRGGVVGYPSETVWGLAALPTSQVATGRLYLLKGRDAHKPVQLSCLDLQEARRWLAPGQPDVDRLARFWPGPLTLLAQAAPGCPPWLAPGGVVGLRVPAHPVIRALLGASGGTLATTSLNPSGQPAAVSTEQARHYALADLLLTPPDAEAQPSQSSGQASTVFDLAARRVLRVGAITEAELLEALS